MRKASEEGVRLAGTVARAGDRVLRALEIENKIKRKRGYVEPGRLRDVQWAVDECAADYLKATRLYVEFFQGATGGEN